MSDIQPAENKETAVDDVRKVRKQLQTESGGDIGKHIEQSNRTLDQYRDKLGLKVVQPPTPASQANGTGD